MPRYREKFRKENKEKVEDEEEEASEERGVGLTKGEWITLDEAKDNNPQQVEWWNYPGLGGKVVEAKQHDPSGPRDKPIWQYENGDQYLGQWKAGKSGMPVENGFGALYNCSPQKFEGLIVVGEFKDGVIHGHAKSFWLESAPTWKNNLLGKSPIRQQINEYGRRISRPFVYEGRYVHDLKHDNKAKVTLKDGTVRVGPWRDGTPISRDGTPICDWFVDHLDPTTVTTNGIKQENLEDGSEVIVLDDDHDDDDDDYQEEQEEKERNRKRKRKQPDRFAMSEHSAVRRRSEDCTSTGTKNGRKSRKVAPRSGSNPSQSLRIANRPFTANNVLATATRLETNRRTSNSSPAARSSLAIRSGPCSRQSEVASSISATTRDHRHHANDQEVEEEETKISERDSRIKSIMKFLTKEVYKNAEPTSSTMKEYATNLFNEGYESTKCLTSYLTLDDIQEFNWMSKVGKKIFVACWNKNNWPTEG